jgi:hypothetical protein
MALSLYVSKIAQNTGILLAGASTRRLPDISMSRPRCNMKEVQVMLGHSTYAFTADVYATLYEYVAVASAETAEQFVARAREKAAGWGSGALLGPSRAPAAFRFRIAADLRRTWDSNPRTESPLLAVFKTAAIGH